MRPSRPTSNWTSRFRSPSPAESSSSHRRRAHRQLARLPQGTPVRARVAVAVAIPGVSLTQSSNHRRQAFREPERDREGAARCARETLVRVRDDSPEADRRHLP